MTRNGEAAASPSDLSAETDDAYAAVHGPCATESEAARVRRAARTRHPDTLTALAADKAVTVRAAVALNPILAEAADLRLVNDPDARVRMLLAGKIARLLPGLSGTQHAATLSHVHTMLMTLAGDAATKVRTAIADAITTMPDAPRAVILKLAHDPVFAISDPVVRMSPLLTDADLLELIATPPHPSTAIAIASRPGLSGDVADGIATHAGSAAVCALLKNTSAGILEATLDALVGRAGEHPDWHEPLVNRPSLSARAFGALSRFVTGHLLDTLVKRTDLPPAVADDVRGRLAETPAGEPPPPSDAELLDKVRKMQAAGQLAEASLLEAAHAGDSRMTAMILAVASDVPLATIERAVALRSAKGLVSLARRADFTMRAGAVVQSVLGRIGPGETLAANPDGSFPLSANEMDWQIELLGEPGR